MTSSHMQLHTCSCLAHSSVCVSCVIVNAVVSVCVSCSEQSGEGSGPLQTLTRPQTRQTCLHLPLQTRSVYTAYYDIMNACICTHVCTHVCTHNISYTWPGSHCLHGCVLPVAAGIVRTHSLGFQECEALRAVYTKDLCPNHIKVNSRSAVAQM